MGRRERMMGRRERMMGRRERMMGRRERMMGRREKKSRTKRVREKWAYINSLQKSIPGSSRGCHRWGQGRSDGHSAWSPPQRWGRRIGPLPHRRGTGQTSRSTAPSWSPAPGGDSLREGRDWGQKGEENSSNSCQQTTVQRQNKWLTWAS